MQVQQGEVLAFIDEILFYLSEHIRDLSQPQARVFYEACGIIIR